MTNIQLTAEVPNCNWLAAKDQAPIHLKSEKKHPNNLCPGYVDGVM
jgi:hypothetical protein